MELLLAPVLTGLVGTAVLTLVFTCQPGWDGIAWTSFARRAGLSCATVNALTGLVTAVMSASVGTIRSVPALLLVGLAIMERPPLQRYCERRPATGFARVVGHVLHGMAVVSTMRMPR